MIDKSRIGIYELHELRHDAGAQTMTIKTTEPLLLRLKVSEINVVAQLTFVSR